MTANANFKVDYKVNQKLKAQKSAAFLGKFGIYFFLAIMSIIVIIPFYWMLNVSLQSTDEVLNSLNVSLFPKEFSPKNYINVFFYTSSTTNINFPRYLTNTLVVAVFSTVGGTIFSIIVAFALARLNFKGKDLIFTILLATMMIPGEMMVISNFVTVARFGWVDAQGVGSYLAMIVPFIGFSKLFLTLACFNSGVLTCASLNSFSNASLALWYCAFNSDSCLRYLFFKDSDLSSYSLHDQSSLT